MCIFEDGLDLLGVDSGIEGGPHAGMQHSSVLGEVDVFLDSGECTPSKSECSCSVKRTSSASLPSKSSVLVLIFS